MLKREAKVPMNEINFDAGDVLAIQGSSLGSRIIQFFTLSWWSHVAMVYDSSSAFESTIKNAYAKHHGIQTHCGPQITPLQFMRPKRGKLYIFKRDKQLSVEQISQLQALATNETHAGKHYSFIKAANSNSVRFINSMYSVAAFLCLICMGFFFLQGLNYTLKSGEASYEDLSLIWNDLKNDAFLTSTYFALLSLFIFFVARPLLLKLINTKWLDPYFRKVGLPDKFIDDPDGQFCSQAIVDIDRNINGGLTGKRKLIHEARPKDIVKFCVSASYNKIRIG
jgi:hypothetical protein